MGDGLRHPMGMIGDERETMCVRILLFGGLRERFGASDVTLDVEPDATLHDVMAFLTSRNPAVDKLLERCRFAVNGDYAGPCTALHDGDEVAVIPPVSGGTNNDRVSVQSEPIDINLLLQHVSSNDAGAVVMFLGVARRHSQGREVFSLEYEAYAPMAEGELCRIAAEMREQWDVEEIVVVHRTGKLEIGEASVAIFVSAAHRKEAFEAARHCIERIKEIVPIWKKEMFAEGEAWVEGA